MLEKNKDYLEMRVSSTDCAFTQNAATTISIEGFSYDTSFRFPDPGESYVIVSKEKFDQLKKKQEWRKATGCDTPEMAEERIKHYKSRLGNAVQAASCAAKHLDNITF